MEHIEIISKEVITKPIPWPSVIIGVITIIAIIAVFIIFLKNKDFDKYVKHIYTFGIIGIVSMLIALGICAIFFRVPTGEYKYSAIINKENITVAEYEEFLDEYNPIIKDGIYYWFGK